MVSEAGVSSLPQACPVGERAGVRRSIIEIWNRNVFNIFYNNRRHQSSSTKGDVFMNLNVWHVSVSLLCGLSGQELWRPSHLASPGSAFSYRFTSLGSKVLFSKSFLPDGAYLQYYQF